MVFTQCRHAAKQFSARRQISLALILGWLLLTFSKGVLAQPQYHSTPFDNPFGEAVYHGSLNDKGQVVGVDFLSSGPYHAGLWLPAPAYGLPAGTNDLGTLGNSYGEAYTINSQGQAVGYSESTSGPTKAFLWLPAPAYGLPAGMNNLGTLGYNSNAVAINSLGQITGNSQTLIGDYDLFLWLPAPAYGLPAGMNDLGTLPGGHLSFPEAINSLGQIVGEAFTSTSIHAFLWLPSPAYGLPAGINDLGTLSGDMDSDAHAINALGQVVGYSESTNGFLRAFLWLPSPAYGLPAGMNDIGIMNNYSNNAVAINDSGQVVVTNLMSDFVWQNGIRIPLNGAPNAFYGQPTAINNSGQIVAGLALLTPLFGPQPNHGGNSPGNLVTVALVCSNAGAVTGVTLLAPGAAQPGNSPAQVVGSSVTPIDAYSVRATFDLSGQAPGPRCVYLNYNDGSVAILPVPFSIDSGGTPQIAVSLIGGNTTLINGTQQQFFRRGRTGTYQLVLTNTGDVDAVGVPVNIQFTNMPPDATFDYSAFNLQTPPPAGLPVNWSAYAPFIQYAGPSGALQTLPILISRLPAGASQSLQISLATPPGSSDSGPLRIAAYSTPFYHLLSPSASQAQAQASLKALAETAYMSAATGQTPDDSAFDAGAAQVIAQMNDLTASAYSNISATGPLTSFAQLADEILLLTPQGQALSAAALQNAVAATLTLTQNSSFTAESSQSVAPQIVGSLDPNGLSGPIGITSGGATFMRGDSPLTFTIGFGNSFAAVIGAQDVALAAGLYGGVDLNQLRVQNINIEANYGGSYSPVSVLLPQQASPIANVRPLAASANIPQANGDVIATSVATSVNLDSSQLLCSFSTDNPAGFLAPGANGTISFSVPWKAGLPAGTMLTAQASITFDGNLPISTATLVYILDNAPPTSYVLPLPSQSGPQFSVQWKGADNPGGCGLQDYTVYVSDNGGPYTVWQSNTTAIQATYSGSIGHTYSFVSQARDYLNNTEVLRTLADAVTTTVQTVTGDIVLEGVPDLSAVSPTAPLGVFHLSFRQPGTTSELFGYNVALTTTTGSPFGTFTLYNIPTGTYDVVIKGSKNLAVLSQSVVVNAAGGTVPVVTLPAGDSNNDNFVDSSDFGTLIGAFNTDSSIPGSGYDPTCDFNFDGVVDSSDFGLLIGEFNNVGAL